MKKVKHEKQFKKGNIPWNKGLKGVQTAWNKGLKGYLAGDKHWAYDKKRPEITGEKSKSWVGDKIGKSGVHQWMERVCGKPSECEFCGLRDEGRKYAWANISGKYKRDVKDWYRLCYPCHMKFDNVGYKSWETRRAIYG